MQVADVTPILRLMWRIPRVYRAVTVSGSLDRTVPNVLDFICVGLIGQPREDYIKRFLFSSPLENVQISRRWNKSDLILVDRVAWEANELDLKYTSRSLVWIIFSHGSFFFSFPCVSFPSIHSSWLFIRSTLFRTYIIFNVVRFSTSPIKINLKITKRNLNSRSKKYFLILPFNVATNKCFFNATLC